MFTDEEVIANCVSFLSVKGSSFFSKEQNLHLASKYEILIKKIIN